MKSWTWEVVNYRGWCWTWKGWIISRISFLLFVWQVGRSSFKPNLSFHYSVDFEIGVVMVDFTFHTLFSIHSMHAHCCHHVLRLWGETPLPLPHKDRILCIVSIFTFLFSFQNHKCQNLGSFSSLDPCILGCKQPPLLSTIQPYNVFSADSFHGQKCSFLFLLMLFNQNLSRPHKISFSGWNNSSDGNIYPFYTPLQSFLQVSYHRHLLELYFTGYHTFIAPLSYEFLQVFYGITMDGPANISTIMNISHHPHYLLVWLCSPVLDEADHPLWIANLEPKHSYFLCFIHGFLRLCKNGISNITCL